jgi:hypothetical protein
MAYKNRLSYLLLKLNLNKVTICTMIQDINSIFLYSNFIIGRSWRGF